MVTRNNSLIYFLVIVWSCLTISCTGIKKDAKQISGIFLKPRGNLVSVQEVAGAGGSVIQVSHDKNKALLIAKQSIGTSTFWAGLGGVSMVTNRGRVTRLIGMPFELRGISNQQSDPLVTGDLKNNNIYQRAYDYMPDYLFGVKVRSTFRATGYDTINVLGFNKTLLKVKEHITFSSGKGQKSHTNTFWLDPQTAQVWKSKQYYAPYEKPLILERAFPPFS